MILGHHLYGFNKKNLDIAIKNNAKIIQFFTRSPQCFKIFNIDYKTENNYAKKNNIRTVIHSSFLINLCKNFEDVSLQNALLLLIKDLEIACDINSLGVVIHMGHNTINKSDLLAEINYINNINYVLSKTPDKSILILETGAGQGREICTQLNKLGKLKEKIDKKYSHRIKFCIDTCHIYAAGYDLKNKLFVETLINYIENTLKWDNVFLIHLNDSKTCLASNKDRHADISTGHIWNKDMNGMKVFISKCIEKKIPIILETPQDMMNFDDQIKLIDNIIKQK
jgi:deoxyribonuclease-4